MKYHVVPQDTVTTDTKINTNPKKQLKITASDPDNNELLNLGAYAAWCSSANTESRCKAALA